MKGCVSGALADLTCYNSGHAPSVKHRVGKKISAACLLILTTKWEVVDNRSPFLVFNFGQEHFNMPLNTTLSAMHMEQRGLQDLISIGCSPLLQYFIHTDISWAYGSLI